MLRLSIENNEWFKISTVELDRGGKSYSIDTILQLKHTYPPDTRIFFLTGTDSVEGLAKWKSIDKILELTTFVIATRPGWKTDKKYNSKLKLLEMPLLQVSSSMIRSRIKDKLPINYLVPDIVVDYIRRKGLYR